MKRSARTGRPQPSAVEPTPVAPAKPGRHQSGGEAESAAVWHRLHPATPYLKSWAVIAALIGATLYRVGDDLNSTLEILRKIGWRWLSLGLIALLLVVFLLALASWLRTRWRIGPTTLELVTGLVFRARRTVRLDRVEAVDIVRPLLPRLLGLVKLKIESAGGNDSAVELGYLKMPDADRWRQTVLAAAAEARQAESPVATRSTPAAPVAAPHLAEGTDHSASADTPPEGTGADASTAGLDHSASANATSSGVGAAVGYGLPPKSAETQIGELLGDSDAAAPELFAVPTKRVVISLLVWPWTWLTVLMIIAGAILFFSGTSGGMGVVAGSLAVGSVVWNRLMSDFGFSAKQTASGLTLSHGLTTRVSQTIAPGRVVALGLSQGPIWRRLGWWRATMNVAGYGNDEKQTLLMPIGDAETVRRAVWAVAPELAQPGAWELVISAMTGRGPTEGFTGAPRRARLFDPIAWKRTAFAVTDQMLILRTGGLLYSVALVPHGRIQALELQSGPFDRRRDLASVIIYSPDGPVSPRIYHLATADALALLKGESDRLSQAMAAQATQARNADSGQNT